MKKVPDSIGVYQDEISYYITLSGPKVRYASLEHAKLAYDLIALNLFQELAILNYPDELNDYRLTRLL